MSISYNPDTKYPLPKNRPPPLVVHMIFSERSLDVETLTHHNSSMSKGTSSQTARTHASSSCHSQLRTRPGGLIQKPPGQVGCLSRGGYRLKDALSWDPEIYNGLQSFLQARIRHYMVEGHLERGSSITNQPLNIILRIQDEAREEYPILAGYQDGWPSRDMMSTYLSKAPCIHHRKKKPTWVLQ
ncbi:hypothetical protein GALMADRAFT_147510 [Galerina marginata CBS 339.88]|uniref:Uncharacterized protein n=1 Tax=Galerina marginata (strain CBS 339.88) TaxID=685588 RepID=A0A067SA94_GALM3|nr:hypothetical protein GALMADRAFT_147510 [Galerina marginata CBS 339.88]